MRDDVQHSRKFSHWLCASVDGCLEDLLITYCLSGLIPFSPNGSDFTRNMQLLSLQSLITWSIERKIYILKREESEKKMQIFFNETIPPGMRSTCSFLLELTGRCVYLVARKYYCLDQIM